MTDKKLITLLKIIMMVGITLIGIGVYLHNFSETMDEMGATGIVISAVFVAFGMILSLPTKMYLTFVLMKHEEEAHKTSKDEQTKPD